MKSVFVFSMIFTATIASASATSSLPSGKLSCNETTKSPDANFSEMKVSFSGKNAAIVAKLSQQRIQSTEQEISEWQKVLAGTAIGGGVATDEDKEQAQKAIDFDHAFLKAGQSGLTFKATFQPYTHQPQGELIRYQLEVTSPGVDATSLWDRLGNEGVSGILRLNPQGMTDVEIYVSGDQGGTYDNFDCNQE